MSQGVMRQQGMDLDRVNRPGRLSVLHYAC